jgi:nucleotide-binding universal stress UspA family protein
LAPNGVCGNEFANRVEGTSLVLKNEQGVPGLPVQSIVFATDFLESSRLALDYAVAFAHQSKATLTIVHALELSREAQEAELLSHKASVSREMAITRLEGFAAGVRRMGIHAQIELREGDPCRAVRSSAAENQADLLVLGTHGVYRGLEHLLLGSNAEKILLSAQCPTLTVGSHVMAGIDLDLRFSEILFVSDFTSEAASAASYALSLGNVLGVRVELLQVAPENAPLNPDLLRTLAEEHCRRLAENSVVSTREWSDPQYYLERLVVADEILLRATQSVNSLIVLGVHSQSRLNRHLHTSFAYELVAKASCPVLSIHADGEEP